MATNDWQTNHYIGGRWIAGHEKIEVVTPIDGSYLATVPIGDASTVDQAVQSARDAFPGWATISAKRRAQYLREVARYIAENAGRFAETESQDTGFLLRQAQDQLVKRAVLNFKYYASFAEGNAEPQLIEGRGAQNLILRKPSGVAAVITPWNSPLVLATWKVAAALASGNTVVLKPASLAPLSSTLIAEAVDATGLPRGVFNLVHGTGSVTGSALAAHPGIARLAFTGSTDTGRHIGVDCARSLTPISFELGGKSPLIVCADSNLDAAAAQVIDQFVHAGQICAAGTRILVEAEIEPRFRKMVLEGIRDTVVVGDPRMATTTLGPLISEAQIARVESLVERAKAEGASVLCGGGRHDFGCLYFAPTVIADVSSQMEIWQEEVFGPVLTWTPFGSDGEAISLANASRYGLGGYLWCNDRQRAIRLASALRTGTVWVNGNSRDLDTPFGGVGDSGIGREGGMWGWEFFCDVSTVAIRRSKGDAYR